MIVRGDAFFHEWEGALPFLECHLPVPFVLSSLSSIVALSRMLASVSGGGGLVRIGVAEERVHPFPHPGAARDAQLERGPAQHLVDASGVFSAGQLREGAADALLG